MKNDFVTVHVNGRAVPAERGSTVLDAVERAGFVSESLCGGKGTCGKCRMLLSSGEEILACRTEVSDGLGVLTFFGADAVDAVPCDGALPETGGEPLFRRRRFELSPPSVADPADDLSRMRRQQPGLEIPPPLFSVLSPLLRRENWNLEGVVLSPPGASFLSFCGGGKNPVALVDLGTTSVSGRLVLPDSGRLLAEASCLNRQYRFGADVITRIMASQENPEELSRLARRSVGDLLEGLAKAAGCSVSGISGLMVSANTAMTHIFYGLPAETIRKMPFVPAVNRYPVCWGPDLGLDCRCLICAVPSVSGYVGGDMVSGILACGMTERESISLLMDLGTNGEIALGCADWVFVCAGSAGPAFEGGGVKCGMRSAPGAVYRVLLSEGEEAELFTVEGREPLGICGTGLVSAVAQLLRHGRIDRQGRFRNGEKRFWLSRRHNIFLDEEDLSGFIRAKAAMYGAVEVLLDYAGLSLEDVSALYLAGGLGAAIRPEDAFAVGLLPEQLETVSLGNTSLAGLSLMVRSREYYAKAFDVAENAVLVELSAQESFSEAWVRACFLPHTDLSLFPGTSVKIKE